MKVSQISTTTSYPNSGCNFSLM